MGKSRIVSFLFALLTVVLTFFVIMIFLTILRFDNGALTMLSTMIASIYAGIVVYRKARKKKSSGLVIISGVIIGALLFGGVLSDRIKASSSYNGDSPVIAATMTDIVTATPKPTRTPAPTATPVPTSTPEVPLEYTPSELFGIYESNPVAADAKLKGRLVRVTGIIGDIQRTNKGQFYVSLNADEWGINSVVFYFLKSKEDEIIKLSKGDTVTIEGKCDQFYNSLFVKVDYGHVIE